MPRYAIAIAAEKSKVLQKLVEGEGQEDALKKFFFDHMTAHYSNDEQGYFYFREDFFEPSAPIGSILEI
jgi:hypothetical protein